jgi:biotin synthase-related radical SAM superfamily protein
MATRAQITRLGQRIEALANVQAASVHGKVSIIVVDGCTEEEAAERHYQVHPEDRSATRKIFLHVVDPPAR